MSTKKYSQFQAMLAIAFATFRSIIRSPSSVVFTLAFPLIFILVFGWIGSTTQGISLHVVLDERSDTANLLVKTLHHSPQFIVETGDAKSILEKMQKGSIVASLYIQKTDDEEMPYKMHITTSEVVPPEQLEMLQTALSNVISRINHTIMPHLPTFVTIDAAVTKIPGRKYRTIDFILPGQLGFSLLSMGVFAVAFSFFHMRQQLVLKRFFATPVKRIYMVAGDALARIVFQLMGCIIIILVGRVGFHFTLVHGFVTFLNLMVLSCFALIVFMGYGFVVSSLAKNESAIPPLANLFTMPQLLLSGTFFSTEFFPLWLQHFCKVLPLTQLNIAMRSISFEGASLLDVWQPVGIIVLWGIGLYVIAIKTFKWEN